MRVSGTNRTVRVSGTSAALLVLAGGWLAIAADGASGAPVDIGAVAEVRAGALPSPIASGGFTVQVGEATGTYAVPPGYGTITAWSHSTGTVTGPLTFKVYRPTGAPQEFLVVASDTRGVTASTVQSFPVQIPVRPGDRIGLSADAVQLAYETDNPADRIGFFSPDPPTGTTKATDGDPFQNFKLDVAATLQPSPAGAGAGSTPPAGATPPGGSPSAPSRAPLPEVTQPTISPSVFASAPSGPTASLARHRAYGANVSYRVSVPATVRFTVQQALPGHRKGTGRAARCVPDTRHSRRGGRCIRMVTLGGGFLRMARTTTNSFHFSGRLGGRRLKPGAYVLVATPTAGARSGRPARARFRIVT